MKYIVLIIFTYKYKTVNINYIENIILVLL